MPLPPVSLPFSAQALSAVTVVWPTLWLGLWSGTLVVALWWVAHRLHISLAAEQGRKKDLGGPRQTPLQAGLLHLHVWVPLCHPSELALVQDTLACLAVQQYPSQRFSVHVLAHPSAPLTQAVAHAEALPFAPQQCQWQPAPPSLSAKRATLWQWGTQQAMAQGVHVDEAGWVFLTPGDLTKPDFLTHVQQRLFEAPLSQGYLAYKDWFEGFFNKLFGQELRLHSRLQLAGRYHAGMGLLVQGSGFMALPQVLEQVPLAVEAKGCSTANPKTLWAWSLSLAEQGLLPLWAPNVVVFQQPTAGLANVLHQQWAERYWRFSLLSGLLVKTAGAALAPWRKHRSLGFYNQRLAALLLPVHGVVLSALLLGLWVLVQQPATAPVCLVPAPWPWALVGVGCLCLVMEGLQSLVARLSWQELAFFMLSNPLWLLAQGILAPWGWLQRRWGGQPTPTEGSPPLATSSATAAAAKADDDKGVATLGPKVLVPNAALVTPLPLHPRQGLALRFAERQVEAELDVLVQQPPTVPSTTYQLVLHYKNHAFRTATYTLLEQAYFELQSKLMPFDIRPHCCGSCAWFHKPSQLLNEPDANEANPAATTEGTVILPPQQVGLCLKQQGLNVHALSNPCTHHTPFEQREHLLKK